MTATTTTTLETSNANERGSVTGPGSRLHGADGLRALAALGVLLHHMYQRLEVRDWSTGQWTQSDTVQNIHDLAIKGGYGVGVFFVLSGMLLSYKFWMAYLTKTPYPRIATYIRRRASRIVPGYYVALLVSFYFAAQWWQPRPGQENIPYETERLISGLTFTNSFHVNTYFPVEANGPLWAIGMEVVSYVLMPLLMWGLYAMGKRGVIKAWGFWVGVVILAAIGQQLIIGHWDISGDWSHLIEGAKDWMPGRNPVGYFGQFALGILASGAIVCWKVYAKGVRSWWFDVASVALFSGVFWLLWSTRGAEKFGYDHDGSLALQSALEFQEQPYLYPTFSIGVALLAIALGFSKLTGRLMDNPFLTFIAKYSFGIYLWHMLIMDWWQRNIDPDYGYNGVSDVWRHFEINMTIFGLTLVFAIASFHLIEKHFLTGIFSGRKKREKVGASE